MSNAAILAEITVTCGECKVLVDSIKGKKTVQTAHYIVEVTRRPVPDGVHLSAAPGGYARARGGGKVGGGGKGGGYDNFVQQQPPSSSIIELQVPTLEVVRRPVVKRTADILAVFPMNLQITPVNDLFNDKLDFTVSFFFHLPPPFPQFSRQTCCTTNHFKYAPLLLLSQTRGTYTTSAPNMLTWSEWW